jgi:hypothetical protein
MGIGIQRQAGELRISEVGPGGGRGGGRANMGGGRGRVVLLFVDPLVEEAGWSSSGKGADVEGVFVGGRVREVIHGR